MVTLKEQSQFGQRVLDIVLDDAKLILYDADKNLHTTALSLHATITELFAGILVMADTERPAAIPIVLRSMYEAFIDLSNLLDDPAYLGHIEAANCKQMLKLLKAADVNPLLAGLTDRRPEIPAVHSELERQLYELQSAGRKPLHISERCKIAGRENEYSSLYVLFCLDSHNNLVALTDRHIDEVDGRSRVNFFADPPVQQLQVRMSHATQFTIGAAIRVHKAFRTGSTAIPALEQQFEGVRPRIA